MRNSDSLLQPLQRLRRWSSSRWVAMVASIWIQCSSGSSYAFGIYSSLLKSTQGYDQSTLDAVGFFKDVGANMGLLSGLLYAASAPWLVLLAGTLQCFSGYFLIWLAITGTLVRPPLWLVCLAMLLAAHAQTFFNTANVVSSVQNFPNSRGTVVGIMKGFLGLSGAILIQVYLTIFKGNPSSFVLMLALLPSVIPLFLICFVRVHPANGGDEKRHLNSFSLIALIIAAYLMVIIVYENVQTLALSMHVFTFVILLLLLVAVPLSIAIRAHLDGSETYLYHESIRLTEDPDPPEVIEQRMYEKAMEKHDSMQYRKISSDEAGQVSSHGKAVLAVDDLNLLQAMCTGNFWLLFVAMACGMGSGLATVNNISQIGTSLSYTSTETSTLVSLWSIWNFLGRFGAGYVSDYFLRLRGHPRPLFMALTLAAMSVGHGVIASGLPGALYAGSVLVGVCYGSQWSLMPTITSEIFGVRHMGTIFNTISVASPVGSYILSLRVVGYIYDMEASSDDDANTCTGTHCFMLSFLIMAAVSIFGFVIALVLFFRTRRFYKQVVFVRLQHSSRAP